MISKEQSPNIDSLINIEDALNDVEGDRGLLRELCDICREDMPDLIDRMRAAFADRDLTAVSAIVHQMKGICSTFHSPKHRLQSELVERLCSERDADRLRLEIPKLATVTEQVVESFELI